MGKLDGKIALVTGGNSGIGLATAKQFVHEGAYVFITGRRGAELAAAVKGNRNRNVTGVQETCRTSPTSTACFAQIKQEKGRLDIVFANAGVVALCRLGHRSAEEFYRFDFRHQRKGRAFSRFRRPCLCCRTAPRSS